MKVLNLLIVDDEESVLHSLHFIFRRKYNVTTASSAEEALEKVAEGYPVELVLSDQRMAGIKGHEFLKAIHEKHAEAVCMLVTGYSDMGDLVEAVNEGHIYGYVNKPWRDDELKILISKAEERYRLFYENVALNQKLKKINQELEQRVVDRTAELNEQKLLLEESNSHLSLLNEQLSDELDNARHTQQFFLPDPLPSLPGIKLAAKYLPMEALGGDVYDMLKLSDDKIAIWLADVTGHGIPAALISMMVVNIFNSYSAQFESPAEAMNLINNRLVDKIEEGKFATAFLMVYDVNTREMTYVSAGHPPPYVLRLSTQEVFPLEETNMLLGAFGEDMVKYEESKVTLMPDDKLFIYTDGIIEFSSSNEFGIDTDEFEKVLKNNMNSPVFNCLDRIYDQILDHFGKTEYDDDITMLMMGLV